MMKVAIIGAGIAGLSCAHELEKYGISPVVYERNSYIGDQYSHVSVILQIANRPLKDAITYVKNEFGLDIMPLNTVDNLLHNAPNKVTNIKGNFGYFIKRGRDEDCILNQIHSKLNNTRVLFNETGDYENLAQMYDFVVIANGTSRYTEELGCWQPWLKTFVRGAVVLGNFNPNTMTMWLNKNYCKDGYAYLTPFNSKKASIVLIVSNVNENEIDHYWELFLNTENLKFTITEEFKLEHKSGHVHPHRLGNIFLAGNAGGVIDPFLGFGQFGAIKTGVMAARSIELGTDYEKSIQDVIKRNLWKYEFRKALNTAANRNYDFIVSAIGLPGVKQFMYYTNFNVFKYGSYIIKLFNKNKNRFI